MSGFVIGVILGVQLAVLAILFGAPLIFVGVLPTTVGSVVLFWRYSRGRSSRVFEDSGRDVTPGRIRELAG